MELARKWVVRVGGKLYLNSQIYSLYPSTATIERAKFFDSEEQAERARRRAHIGEVVEVVISDSSLDESEIDMLRASVLQLQNERDEAKRDLSEALEIIGKMVNGDE